ncbi:MAG: hypothetical protein V4473_01975 [Patescibacteria group bacterium]
MQKINNYVILIILYLIVGGVFYYYQSTFLNSNFFVGSATFIVGTLAFYIYTQQKADEKSNAATTVLLEVRNAEGRVDIIIDALDKNAVKDLPTVLPTNSWRKYSHLFVKDFDLDDIQLLNTFYSSCEIIEDLANRQNNFVWITTEERARTVQARLAMLHDDFQIETLNALPGAQEKFNVRKRALDEFYGNDSLSYAPDKILKGLRFQTQNLKRVASTPCGVKLKNSLTCR